MSDFVICEAFQGDIFFCLWCVEEKDVTYCLFFAQMSANPSFYFNVRAYLHQCNGTSHSLCACIVGCGIKYHLESLDMFPNIEY